MNSTISYTYDAGDQLLSAGSTTYAYDNNGNLEKKTEREGTTSYGYNSANRLSTVSLSHSYGHRTSGSDDYKKEKDADITKDSLKEKDGNSSHGSLKEKNQTTVLRFTYDGDGNRIGKSVTRLSKTDSTQYLWDINHGLPQVLTESDAKGTALYSYGLGRISMADPRKGQMYYQYDGLGSVRSLTDRKGMTRGLYAYDAFGKPLISASPVDNDFRFAGEQMDTETGLIYLRARYYDPETGRFISRDPFTGFDTAPQSLNRYTYVQNNPVQYTDPSGRVAWWVAPAAIGAVVNAGWYVGMDVVIGGQQFSTVTLGGRITGGAAGGVVGAYTMATTLNPWAAGAAASGTSYTVDRGTQAVLAGLGVKGTQEGFSLVDGAVATGSGSVMGKVSYSGIPYSPKNTFTEKVERNIISKAGTGSVSSVYGPVSPSVNSYVSSTFSSAVVNSCPSCQGGPVRMGGGSIYLPGQKLN